MCVGVLVGVGVSGVVVVRKQRGNTGAAFREEEEEEEEEEACVTFFLFGDAQKNSQGNTIVIVGKKNDDGQKVRARARWWWSRASLLFYLCRRRCLEARIGANGFRSSRLVPSFFCFSARRVSTRERERDCERKWLPPILSLSFSLSLSYRARFAETTTEWFR